MARRRKLGGTYDELEQALKEVEGWKPKPDECRPQTRHSFSPLKLTATQCAVFPVGKELAEGSYATVFVHAHDPSKVVKFTTDVADARAAAALKGKWLKGATHVYEVAELRKVLPNRTIYGIVTERVKPADETMHDAITDFARALVRAEDALVRTGQTLRPSKRFKLPKGVLEEALAACQKREETACRIIPELAEATTELAQVGGVFTSDLHYRNWGFRENGSPVILDFGVSRVTPKPRVLKLAGTPRRVAKRRRVR